MLSAYYSAIFKHTMLKINLEVAQNNISRILNADQKKLSHFKIYWDWFSGGKTKNDHMPIADSNPELG